MDNATIAAIATPPGPGGIGIIRISGRKAFPAASALFRKGRTADISIPPESWESHRVYYGRIIEPENGRTTDEVLMLPMRSPRSYTGEDVMEIHGHSGPAALRAILEKLLDSGIRLAEPGEFTRRAFVSGRVDLTQAEAVIDLIRAETDQALDIAVTQVMGEMRDRIEILRNALTELLTITEAGIDFPDEVNEISPADSILPPLRNQILPSLEELMSAYEEGRILREGVRIIVVGRPNVGKSSLMNRLLRRDRAIVTPIPGTTRDIIEESVIISGIQAHLSDCAGIHPTDDPVEQMGIDKALEQVDASDLVLFMTEAGEPVTEEDRSLFERVCGRPLIRIINKTDLLPGKKITPPPDSWRPFPEVRISALENRGIGALKDAIAEILLKQPVSTGHRAVPNMRQQRHIRTACDGIRNAVTGIQSGLPVELISIDLREASDALGDVIGVTIREDLLDRIFDQFCIGK